MMPRPLIRRLPTTFGVQPTPSIAKVSASATLAAALVGGGLAIAPAAQAATPPPDEQMITVSANAGQNPNENTVTGVVVQFATPTNGGAPQGTIVKFDVYSCGQLIATMGYTMQASGRPPGLVDFNSSQQRLIGPSIQFVGTFTHPGYDTYTVPGSYDGYNVARPSCQEINHPLVVTWSKKRGAARIGRVASVTPTSASGARITYAWRLRPGTSITASGRKVRVTRAMRGKSLSVTVRVSKAGYRPKTRVLNFGRVR